MEDSLFEDLCDEVALSLNSESTMVQPKQNVKKQDQQEQQIIKARAHVSTDFNQINNEHDEEFSGIRVKNRLVSRAELKERVVGYNVWTLENLKKTFTNTGKFNCSGSKWVLFGIVSESSKVRTTVKGDRYLIWKLIDLHGTSVSLFLFETAFESYFQNQKVTSIGSLVCVSSARSVPATRDGAGIAFSVTSSKQIMVIGKAMDYGKCLALKAQNGGQCEKIIDTRDGKYCSFHLKNEYKRLAAERMVLHHGISKHRGLDFGMRTGKIKNQNLSCNSNVRGDNSFYVGGSNLSASISTANKKFRNKDLEKFHEDLSSMKSIGSRHVKDIFAKLDPDDIAKANFLAQPSASGSCNIKKTGIASPSVTGSVLHTPQLPTNSYSNAMVWSRGVPSIARDGKKLKSNGIRSTIFAHELRALRDSSQLTAPNNSKDNSISLKHYSKRSHTFNSSRPMLGRGLKQSDMIILDQHSPNKYVKDKIQAMGGLPKPDPNNSNVRIRPLSSQGKKRKKLSSSLSSSPFADKENDPLKRQRNHIFGGLPDISSVEGKKLIEAPSLNQDLAEQQYRIERDAYADNLAESEKIDEKMQDMKEIKLKAYSCSICAYIREKPDQKCLKAKHKIITSKTIKRFFECKICHYRTSVIGAPFPIETCIGCGGNEFERCSMYKTMGNSHKNKWIHPKEGLSQGPRLPKGGVTTVW